MSEVIEETEEQAAARILAWRCARALADAADVAMHVRAIAISGRTERGETLPEWSAPMLITAADDSDSMFAQLVNWVEYWSEQLNFPPPSTAVVAWSNIREIQGFRGGTTPEYAHLLVQLQAFWLKARAEAIAEHETAGTYQEDIVRILGELRGRYPLAPRAPKPISLRPCPLCGENAVGATWLPDVDVSDLTEPQARLVQLVNVDVRCEHCGLFAPATSPAQLLRWLA